MPGDLYVSPLVKNIPIQGDDMKTTPLVFALMIGVLCTSCIAVDSGRHGKSGSAPGHNKVASPEVIIAPKVKIK